MNLKSIRKIVYSKYSHRKEETQDLKNSAPSFELNAIAYVSEGFTRNANDLETSSTKKVESAIKSGLHGRLYGTERHQEIRGRLAIDYSSPEFE